MQSPAKDSISGSLKSADDELPAGKSYWDRLPQELVDHIFTFASPLTLFIHGRLTKTPESLSVDTRRQLWLEVLEMDWMGDLTMLPGTGILSTTDLVENVQSRSMFERLCARLPQATEANGRFSRTDAARNCAFAPKRHHFNEDTFDSLNDNDATAKGYTVPSPQFLAMRDTLKTLPTLRLRHVAMHHGWIDLIDTTKTPIALAHDSIRFGYADLLRHLSTIGKVDLAQIASVPYAEYRVMWPHLAIDVAASYGHMDIVELLHASKSKACSTKAMDWAAWNGRLNVVKWLHENRSEGCTEAAMDGAAAIGRLDIVQWLHENRSEGCTLYAIDQAAEGGHIHVVKWLLSNRSESFSVHALSDGVSDEMAQLLVSNLSDSRRSQMLAEAERLEMSTAIRYLRHPEE